MLKRLYDAFINLSILPKLIISYLMISLAPLVIIGMVAHMNLSDTGFLAIQRAEEMGAENLKAAQNIGKTSIDDSVQALDRKATEAIELRTVELAVRIADFLYERDKDILFIASVMPDADLYRKIFLSANRPVISTDRPTEAAKKAPARAVASRNRENQTSWRHLPPMAFPTVSRPLYREIAFIDLKGQEKIKVAQGRVSENLLDVSKKENTYCGAEDYFPQLGSLKKGEIYVSRVIGAYVPGWIEKTKEGLKVRKDSAYSGMENPGGRKFEGIIRWATPVYDGQGDKMGYVAMALDHTHLMEFTDHVVPTAERFSILSDGGSGNYAFIWDDQGRCISHARDFFICGFDPETGREVPGWISQESYNNYKKSGISLEEYTRRLPSYRQFSQHKAPALEQVKAGRIPLNCRILDTAPQCQGWHEGTADGGSGSFLILWSGLWKLTTYAAIPYYTGPYGHSKRGFGYVTIGANVDDFHKDANITKVKIEKSIFDQGRQIMAANEKTRALITGSASRNRTATTLVLVFACLTIVGASTIISLSITGPLRRLTDGARAMSKGDYNQSIELNTKDEVGQLAASFNEMAKSISEVDKMKSEFVTIASHELRTPIQAMMLGVSGILDGYSGQIDDEVREDLHLARLGIERLMHLVEDLLDLSRIEARKVELQIHPVSMTEIVGQAVAEVSDLAQAHSHTIIQDMPEALPQVQADRGRMMQVLINLLSNAIKYNPDGGSIIIKVEIVEDNMILSIADNGYGVPSWAQEEIFKKFFQADAIMSQKVGGCGLGLTIAKGLVEKHGGHIQCVSPVPGGMFPGLDLDGERQGALFTIHLPLA